MEASEGFSFQILFLLIPRDNPDFFFSFSKILQKKYCLNVGHPHFLSKMTAYMRVNEGCEKLGFLFLFPAVVLWSRPRL